MAVGDDLVGNAVVVGLKAVEQIAFAGEAVIFIGADAPDIQISEIEAALVQTREGKAYIQRAHDGGYVLLGLPATVTRPGFVGCLN